MDLQEAANVFENFTTKYRRTTPREEQSGVDELRTKSIFKVAVAFEKVVLTNQESEWLSNWQVDLLTDWLTVTDCLSEALGYWMTNWFHDRKKDCMNFVC